MDITPLSPVAKRKRMPWLKVSLITLAVLVVGYGVLVVGVNWYGWRGARATALVRYVPVPVALIGWQPVGAYDVLKQTTALQHFQDYQRATSTPSDTIEDARASAATKTLKDHALMALLKKYDLKVSTADVDAAYTTQLSQTGSASTIDGALKDLYDWTAEPFKKYVIAMDVARDRLREKFAYDPTLSAPLKKQAEDVKGQIAADGKNFADLATRYSQDAYAAKGGDTDFIKRNELTKELEDAAFALPVDGVSDVIQTKYGFHIIQVIERKGEGDAAEVHLRSIFIAAPSVDDAITKYLSDHRVRMYLRGMSWDTAASQVTVSGASS